jgi:hypothetical protein
MTRAPSCDTCPSDMASQLDPGDPIDTLQFPCRYTCNCLSDVTLEAGFESAEIPASRLETQLQYGLPIMARRSGQTTASRTPPNSWDMYGSSASASRDSDTAY